MPAHVTLLPENDDDRYAASQAAILKARGQRISANDWKSKRRAVMRSSIFNNEEIHRDKKTHQDTPAVSSVLRKRKTVLDKARFVAGLQQARPRPGAAIRVRRSTK